MIDRLLIATGIAFIIFAFFASMNNRDKCEAVGGNIVSFYNGSLCVRDGLIVEDY
jgi:hypothetical protein